jgi:pilus assembly protein Flp/PilA
MLQLSTTSLKSLSMVRISEHRGRISYRFLADESGATAIEYGLIAAGISIAIIVAVNGLGGNLNTKVNSINTSLK